MSSQSSVAIWVPAEGRGSAGTASSIAATTAPEVEILDAASAPAAVTAAGRRDLVVVMPGILVFDGWLARLVAAAYCDSVIASASALLSRGDWAPSSLDEDMLEVGARSVAEHSGCLHPRIGAPRAGCVLLRRPALDVVGEVTQDAPASVAGWIAEFAERCSALGLGHVLADDLLVGGASEVISDQESAALDARWPHRRVARALDAEPESPAEHALLVASRALGKLSVTIDGRSLGPERAGTQVHALELIAALGRTGAVRLRVVTPPDLHPLARQVLDGIEDLTTIAYEDVAHEAVPVTDIVHRPNQVFTVDDLMLLAPLGRRLVVTQQDLVAYRIPGYHGEVEHWVRYRRTTRDVLAAADHVVFFSEHARADALVDHLVLPASSSVVPIGVDHCATGASSSERRPPAIESDDPPFLLCLGADLPHKHHGFAIELLRALRRDCGWDGRLVFAGPTGNRGAFELDERDASVLQLGPVDEDEKQWLLAHAAAVVYPTLYEGFGLIPFEAGSAGTPCLFAAHTALAEVLPAAAATLVPWDASASAAAAGALLHPGKARDAHVEMLRRAASDYRWDDTAAALVSLYDSILIEARRGARERLRLEGQLREIEHLRAVEWQNHLGFREHIGSDALGLVGPGGVLAPADQRALLALMSRPGLRRPVLAAARAAYAAAMRLRRS